MRRITTALTVWIARKAAKVGCDADGGACRARRGVAR
jgi:hypothetical protein